MKTIFMVYTSDYIRANLRRGVGEDGCYFNHNTVAGFVHCNIALCKPLVHLNKRFYIYDADRIFWEVAIRLGEEYFDLENIAVPPEDVNDKIRRMVFLKNQIAGNIEAFRSPALELMNVIDERSEEYLIIHLSSAVTYRYFAKVLAMRADTKLFHIGVFQSSESNDWDATLFSRTLFINDEKRPYYIVSSEIEKFFGDCTLRYFKDKGEEVDYNKMLDSNAAPISKEYPDITWRDVMSWKNLESWIPPDPKYVKY